MVDALTPNITVIGGGLVGIHEGQTRPQSMVLLSEDWCPYKNKRSPRKPSQTEDPGGHSDAAADWPAKTTQLTRNQPHPRADLSLPASGTKRTCMSVCRPPNPW